VGTCSLGTEVPQRSLGAKVWVRQAPGSQYKHSAADKRIEHSLNNTLDRLTVNFTDLWHQGRSDGGIWVYIPQKSVQVNFLLGRNDVRTAIEHEY